MTSRLIPLNRLGLTLAGIAVLAIGAVSSAGSCTGSQNNGFGGAGGSDAVNHGKELFDVLDQELYSVCGQCHDVGGISDAPFLAGPDHYRSITSWPGIVVKDATKSKIETIPVTGPQHPYKKLDSPEFGDTLYPKVKAWLEEEARALAAADQPDAGVSIAPFAPILGFNAVYLDAFGPEFTGMALNFNADQLDEHTLRLTNAEMHPTAKLGLHVVHPLFGVVPVGGEVDLDPADSFSNVDQTFDPGVADLLGPGTLILTNWRVDGKLTIDFEKIEIKIPPMTDGGGVPTGGCKDVGSFNTNAAPLLMANCTSCHGGGNPMAVGAVDMSALGADPAATCAQVKNRVNPADPPSSQLFVTTDPGGNAAHPFKFGGDANNFGNFKAQVSIWIPAEK